MKNIISALFGTAVLYVIAVALLNIAFFGGIIYVIVHFASKFW